MLKDFHSDASPSMIPHSHPKCTFTPIIDSQPSAPPPTPPSVSNSNHACHLPAPYTKLRSPSSIHIRTAPPLRGPPQHHLRFPPSQPRSRRPDKSRQDRIYKQRLSFLLPSPIPPISSPLPSPPLPSPLSHPSPPPIPPPQQSPIPNPPPAKPPHEPQIQHRHAPRPRQPRMQHVSGREEED